MSKKTIPDKDKISAVMLYFEGNVSQHQLAERLGESLASVQQWIRNYQASYQQARSYTMKYESGGVEALRDNRGKRKNPDEMNELERLRAENKILCAQKNVLKWRYLS